MALGAEVFAERWTPIIVRNLMMGCERYSQILEGAPGLPRSVLSQRLRHLESDGVVVRVPTATGPAYRLTPAGHELGAVCMALGAWAARWREARPVDMDPYLALWMLAQLVDPASLPRDRVVVRFDLTDQARPNRYWVVTDRLASEVCATYPGFTEDGIVTTDSVQLVRWHSGHISLPAAIKAGRIRFDGPRWLARLLTAWGHLSPFAPA